MPDNGKWVTRKHNKHALRGCSPSMSHDLRNSRSFQFYANTLLRKLLGNADG